MHTHLTNSLIQRRRIGAAALAVVALMAVLRLRASCESPLSIVLELMVQAAILGLGLLLLRQRALLTNAGRDNQQTIALGGLLLLTPSVLQAGLRTFGHGTGWELVAMSSLAWVTLFSTLCAQRQRALGTSVVCSGFLTLLATCSSDKASALLFALSWGALCLWWLASSHWERAQRCQVSTVLENRWQRPIIVVVGCLVFAVSAWSVAGRFPPAQRLPWEIAPTSGGTTSNDEFARAGVGDGDALVAARENAASFGAVDSDLMLDSKEASLFDLYSDTFGEPVRKQDVERTVALAPQQQEVAQPANMAHSDGASAALTTKRRAGTTPKPLTNRASEALLFWIGRADMHLALERFSYFDGTQWHATEPNSATTGVATIARTKEVKPIPSGNKTWFTVDARPSNAILAGTLAEAVKYARLRSPRIPSVAGMHSWHINQVDDGSFFEVDASDNLSMPGRTSVPEFTIVRYVNREVNLEALSQAFYAQPQVNAGTDQGTVQDTDQGTSGRGLARAMLDQWLLDAGKKSAWETITLVASNLRAQFRLDRTLDTSSSPDPLADFFTQRAGNDLMFATAAACMLREVGYRTRLVTGFVAKAENRLGWTKELAIYAQDTHAWVEVQTAAGEWIPLEPTPGYPLPNYRVSWRYWLTLHAREMVWAGCMFVSIAALVWWQRAMLFDGLCQLALVLCWFFDDRWRCRWLVNILDCRSRLAGCARPAHVSPQRWYAVLSKTDHKPVAQSTLVFFSEADRLCFGDQRSLSQAGRAACRTLWTRSTCRVLRNAMQGLTKNVG